MNVNYNILMFLIYYSNKFNLKNLKYDKISIKKNNKLFSHRNMISIYKEMIQIFLSFVNNNKIINYNKKTH